VIIKAPLVIGDIELKSLDAKNVSKNYASWLNNSEINQYTEARFLKHDCQNVLAFIKSCNVSKNSMLLGIFYMGEHIGNIKADINSHHKTASIGLIIGKKDLQGKGIGSKSIEILCDYIFEKFGVFKINAGLYESNMPSEKAFEKAGFEKEYMKQSHVINTKGERENVIVMVKYAS